MGLGYNRALRDENGQIYDILCGPFFVCGLGTDDFLSLPEQLMKTYFKHFKRPELFVRIGKKLMVIEI